MLRRSRAGTVLAAVLALLLGGFPSAALAQGEQKDAGGVAFPSPGDGFAPPGVDLTLRGLDPVQLRGLQVTGSVTGEHQGALRALPDGRGATFDPTKDFQPGEKVTVDLPAGTRLQDSSGGDYTFTVARLGNAPDPNTLDTAGETPAPGATAEPETATEECSPHLRRSVSRPELGQLPGACVASPARGTGEGSLFTTLQQGPTIFNDRGRVMWHKKSDAPMNDNLKVVEYLGQDMLAYYQGAPPPEQGGHGLGEYVLLNQHYQQVATISAADGYRADLHELTVTPQGTAFVGIYAPVVMDLSPYGGRPGTTVYDYVVQEIDIATGAKLFEWHALDHIDITDSHVPVPTGGGPYDWFHGNAIDIDKDGNLLVSGRHTWATYKIDRLTGELIWTLGGKNSSFDPLTTAPGVPEEEAHEFCWQHDIRALPDGSYTLFDNGSSGGDRCGPSRGLELELDPATGGAIITDVYRHSPDIKDIFAGNMQTLPNGNKVIGWGNVPQLTEFHADGTVALDMRLTDNSYRAFRFDWTGLPLQPPAVAAETGNGGMTVFASWNGSTEVTQWRVLTGNSVDGLSPAGPPQQKTGFETALQLDSPAHVVRVQALDADGNVLDTSPPLFWSAATGAHIVEGAILDRYLQLDGPNGVLGYPVTDERTTPDGVGRYNHFNGSGGGSIYWTPSTGAHAVYGAIREKWAALGWERGPLGYPVTDETSTPDGVGRFNHFNGSGGGSIYWTPSTGAHAIRGAIRNRWEALGWERGPLGYPTTDETGTPDGVGRYNHFSGSGGGSVYWTPRTGAQEVYGRIRDRWSALGWERSYLGYPKTGEFSIPGGRRNNFQSGYIEWYADTNSTRDSSY